MFRQVRGWYLAFLPTKEIIRQNLQLPVDLGFEKEDGSLVSFSLGDNQINISDFHPGNSHAEAQLQIDLGFDMMREWSNTTSKKMSYSFNISNGSNGPEKFLFLTCLPQLPQLTT